MFSRFSLANACIFASTHALKHGVGASDFLAPLNLAQTQATDGGCCCEAFPCMPGCHKPCPEPNQIIPDPIDDTHLPQPVRDIVFNLDVILTTLMHTQGPEIEIEWDDNDPDEVSFVNNVATPVIIQLLNNDVMPAIPTCTFPQGQSPDDYGLAEGSFIDGGVTVSPALENNMPDPVEVARQAILLAMENTSLPDEIDINSIIDEALEPARGMLLDSTMTSEEVGKEIQLIISGIESSINTWSAHISSDEKIKNEEEGGEPLDIDDYLEGEHLYDATI